MLEGLNERLYTWHPAHETKARWGIQTEIEAAHIPAQSSSAPSVHLLEQTFLLVHARRSSGTFWRESSLVNPPHSPHMLPLTHAAVVYKKTYAHAPTPNVSISRDKGAASQPNGYIPALWPSC